MDIWEQLYLRAKEQYAPQEISPFLYARHVVCALESADGRIFNRFLHGKLLRCDGPVRRAGGRTEHGICRAGRLLCGG